MQTREDMINAIEKIEDTVFDYMKEKTANQFEFDAEYYGDRTGIYIQLWSDVYSGSIDICFRTASSATYHSCFANIREEDDEKFTHIARVLRTLKSKDGSYGIFITDMDTIDIGCYTIRLEDDPAVAFQTVLNGLETMISMVKEFGEIIEKALAEEN